MVQTIYFVLALAVAVQFSCVVADGEDDERSAKKVPSGVELLKKVLFEDYDADVAPEDLEVEVGVSLRCAFEHESVKGATSVNAWETFIWTDNRLTWDPKKFDGVDEIHVGHGIWHPDIQLYNSIEESPWEYRNSWNDAILHSDGTIYIVPQATYQIFCAKDTCTLSLGSWTYSGSQLKLSLYEEGVNIDHLDENCPLKISEPEASIKNTEYDCCPGELYPSLEVSFTVSGEEGDGSGASGDYSYEDYYEDYLRV